MSSKKIKAKALTITIKNKNGNDHTISGYIFSNRLTLIPGSADDCASFFESLGVLLLSAPGGSTVSAEEGLEWETTELDLLNSVIETMKKKGSRCIPMEQILYLLWQVHSSD